MYPLNTSSLAENSVIANDLYDQNGNILLMRGTRLKPKIIQFLRHKGIDRVFLLTQPDAVETVEMEGSIEASKPNRNLLDPSYVIQKHSEPGAIREEILESLHTETLAFYQRLAFDGKLDLDSLRYAASEAADFMMEHPSTTPKINDLKFFQGDLPTHSVNVAVLSLFAGRYFDLPRRNLRDLVLGALLHDVGLTVFGIEPSRDMGRIFAESANPIPIGTHPETGVRMLKKNRVRDEALLNIVYNHHERHDGLGYPRKLAGSEIGLASSLVTLANDFVTLSSTASNGGIMPGSRVMSLLMRDIGKAYSPEAAWGFINMVGIYPVGSFLHLSNGETGLVVDNPSGNILTPRLMLICNAEGEEIEPTFADLSESEGVYVSRILNQSECPAPGSTY
jgi:hypothetical protein